MYELFCYAGILLQAFMAVRRTTLFLVVIPSSTFTATTIYTNSYVWLDALDTCIIPVHLYACQTWSLTTKHKNIEFSQRKRVRKILGVSTTNRISNTQLQELSMLKSAAQQASRSKWKWVGHVPRLHHTRDRISNTQLQEWSMLKSAAQQASRSKW